MHGGLLGGEGRRFTLAMTDVGEVYFMPVLIERCRAAKRAASRTDFTSVCWL